jgi:hypothetical protein
MPLYYFHLVDGVDVLLDPEGIEIASAELIPGIVLREARSIISCDAAEGNVNLTYHIDVEDASGRVVHCLDFEDAVDVVRGIYVPPGAMRIANQR